MNKSAVTQFLIDEGFNMSLKGFTYLISAIMIYDSTMTLTKELYPALAKKYNTSAVNIGRDIGYAIKTSQLRGSKIKEYWTTHEFLAYANYIVYAKYMVKKEYKDG